ncbi:MAG: hypothetical protein IJ172_07785, partial [Ruminococcus sp.]|nr:hypothetical protein [Ruminococcus sp.]
GILATARKGGLPPFLNLLMLFRHKVSATPYPEKVIEGSKREFEEKLFPREYPQLLGRYTTINANLPLSQNESPERHKGGCHL